MSEIATSRFRTLGLLLLSVLCTVVLSGCFDELSGPYDGEDKIAFGFDLIAQAQSADQPATISVSEPGGAERTVTLKTELIGPQRSSDTQVSYGVAEETVTYVKEFPADTGGVARDTTILARGTTAEEGTNYEISGSYTLPADSSSAPLTLTILDGIPDGGSSVRVALRLDGNPDSNLQPAETMRYLTVRIVPN